MEDGSFAREADANPTTVYGRADREISFDGASRSGFLPRFSGGILWIREEDFSSQLWDGLSFGLFIRERDGRHRVVSDRRLSCGSLPDDGPA